MVSRKDKLRATQFICHQLEDSGLYIIQRRDHQEVLVKEKPDVREEPRTIDVLIPNFLKNIKSFTSAQRVNQRNRIYTCPLFYKDGKTAFVRMVERNPSWREEKSLKRYTPQQINQMLHLRGMEKEVMELLGENLTYYQPETSRLTESLREFNLEEVRLDYSHIRPGDQGYGFVRSSDVSIDYKLPHETRVIEPAAKFAFRRYNQITRLSPAKSRIKEELTEQAKDYFPGLESVNNFVETPKNS